MFSAVVAGTLAVAGRQATLSIDAIRDFWENPLHDGGVRTLIMVIALAYLMALFPDTDTASKPRRFLDRTVFVILLACLWTEAYEIAVLVALAAIAPLLQKHRGWTHSWWTPWVFAVLFAIAWEIFRAENAWFSGFSWNNVFAFMKTRWIFTIAIAIGYYTHLLLDRPAFTRLRTR